MYLTIILVEAGTTGYDSENVSVLGVWARASEISFYMKNTGAVGERHGQKLGPDFSQGYYFSI